MIGLIILIVGVIYLTVLVVVTRAAYRWAKSKGLSKAKCRLAAAGGFLTVYLPVFWDHIPTVITHQYYCKTEAGFWVYKTVDQWKAENPGVMETLVEDKHAPFKRVGDNKNYIDTKTLNQRFRWEAGKYRPLFLLPVYSWKSEIVDSKNGKVVARYVDLSSGEGRDYLKFWMNISNCSDGISNRNALYQFVGAVVDINKGEAK